MKDVETESEAFVSTDSLFKYIAGEAFEKCCGATTSFILSEWLRNSFFSMSHQLLFWHRLSMRSFDEYCNSVCEGQNSAAKTSDTGAKANHSLSSSVGCLDQRAALKERGRLADIETHRQSVPLYSNTEAGSFVTSYAELNAHAQCKGFTTGADKYWMWKRDAQTIWVMRKKHVAVTTPGA
jgi:hypothetical protein